MSSHASTIKERLPITDVVSSYLRLEKAGNYLRARCPFHNEKTPSFYVSPARGTFRCFGCGKSGDVIAFVQEIEGLTFPEALVRLADRAGVTLTFEKKTPEDMAKIRLGKIHEDAVLWYKEKLNENPSALEYLHGRGLTDETIAAFSLGVSSDAWDDLTTHLRTKGYNDADLLASGLCLSGTRGLYDRFRSRIMFPIRDSVGKTVAFTGRILPVHEKESGVAKYVNSPETPLYVKSTILFGYDMAKRSFLKDNRAIVVEGQMDLLMAYQAGTTSVVAVSGTALSEEHLRLIKRFTDTIVFSFDADSAGVKASERSVELALSLGMNVEMIVLPHAKDPADLIRDNPELWKKSLTETRHIVEYLLFAYTKNSTGSQEKIRAVTGHVLPMVARIPNAIEEAHYISRIAETIGVPEDAIRKEVEKVRARSTATEGATVEEGEEKEARRRYQMLEDEVLAILSLTTVPPEDYSFAKESYEKIRKKDYASIWEDLPPERKDTILFTADVRFSKDPPTHTFIVNLLLEFEQAFLEEKLRRITLLIKKAEKEKNEEEVKKYLQLSRDTLQELETHKKRSL